MNSEFKFAADRIDKNKAYPALATWSARPYTKEWRQFVAHWPRTVPCELLEHCATHKFPYKLHTVRDCVHPAFYPIGLGFFDFTIDYFSLINPAVIDKIRNRQLHVLFYYHEGDNPFRIRERLNSLCQTNNLPDDCYSFVSGNTAADKIDNFIWFPDHELLYWHRNRRIPATSIHLNARPYQFTVLNRTHKWWRATVMADLQRHSLLEHSQWSYNTNLSLGDDPNDNPIEIDVLDLRSVVESFVDKGPYRCDDLTQSQHNNHHLHVAEHFAQSYCHIVIETHFDADQSGGAFLTEKTFKAIKHGQPFVIVGAPGSLAALRKLGYRTFDHAMDNSYDLETDNTQRWKMLLETIRNIAQQDMHAWFESCLEDVCHNQNLFCKTKYPRLNTLYDKLLHQLATT